ncbi:hypothetical protein [Hymenobacter coccineus]|uniref:Uncharacterized protein n=1 Tax=Hymenobacter coccineus TaxID=1908235 RepID=A0A1G1TG65_9BACT|nr:hypothetical protein [Hymenobacter coccineus]OGX89864.1 hypothetical protein BEN49_00755 [Hymenobacter coccineus]
MLIDGETPLRTMAGRLELAGYTVRHAPDARLGLQTLVQYLNATNYTAAATAIGGDAVTTKIFWDKL